MKAGKSADCFRESARAKLNLFLDVREKRPDGYHEMRMVMQTIALCDDVSVRLRPDGVRTLTCSGLDAHTLAQDETNLAWRAAARFLEDLGWPEQGFALELYKRIPTQAGLAGGSADGAAVLRAMNRAFGSPCSEQELCRTGARVGSDVPYCVRGGTMLAQGRGELLRPLPPLRKIPVVLCKPPFACSTPALFAALDRVSDRALLGIEPMLRALSSGSAAKIGPQMRNAFEPVAMALHPPLRTLRDGLLQCGACGAMLTGTGSAVFGLFDSKLAAARAVELLRPLCAQIFLTETV